MPNDIKKDEADRKSIIVDRRGVKRAPCTVFIPIPQEAKALALRGRMKRPNGETCLSLKAVYETLLEKALK